LLECGGGGGGKKKNKTYILVKVIGLGDKILVDNYKDILQSIRYILQLFFYRCG